MSAKCDHRILCVGLSWSIVNTFGNCFIVTWKVWKSIDYTFQFFLFALNANLWAVGFVCSSCLVLMYTRSRVVAKELYYLIAAYVLIFPVFGVFVYNEDSDFDVKSVMLFGTQAVLGVAFGYLLKYYYNKKFKSPKK